MKSYEKLKQNWEFRRVYAKGKCIVLPELIIYVAKGRQARIRLGITAGKKLGIAVKRNRAKRVITAAFRQCVPQINKGLDFVIVARPRILAIKSTDVASALICELKRNGFAQ